ncbi:MAG TPA: hydrogenase/urease maturation nickel metallochaperone HypA [Thermoplasmata archaeon]|nr:hydrogenase/urease maturation nickel metallochaperone HypA [Thermoplasmata archaeon]
MHEEALLRDLRRKLEELAPTGAGERITVVRIWLGALSHVPESTLRGRWAETVKGTGADGSRLEIERSSDLADPRAQGLVLAGVDLAPIGGG